MMQRVLIIGVDLRNVYKHFTDIIIPQGKSNTVAIDLLKTKINSIFNEKML